MRALGGSWATSCQGEAIITPVRCYSIDTRTTTEFITKPCKIIDERDTTIMRPQTVGVSVRNNNKNTLGGKLNEREAFVRLQRRVCIPPVYTVIYNLYLPGVYPVSCRNRQETRSQRPSVCA